MKSYFFKSYLRLEPRSERRLTLDLVVALLHVPHGGRHLDISSTGHTNGHGVVDGLLVVLGVVVDLELLAPGDDLLEHAELDIQALHPGLEEALLFVDHG